MSDRILNFAEAIREGTRCAMQEDPSVYIMGLGVTDPKGIFGTTTGLCEEFGPQRVFDVPVSENALTGIALGSAIAGKRPILTHQRIDFALLSIDQLVTQAAKWHYMFGGKACAPLVIRAVIGRGWGQGPQHSQNFTSLFAHVPGLKVVLPSTPADAKGLMISAVRDNNPVLYLEHRWLHAVTGHVPAGSYATPIGPTRTAIHGKDVTIVATSYMTLEALKAARILSDRGVEAEVIDVRTANPLDDTEILESVRKTGHLVVAELDWKHCGLAGEIVARVAEKGFRHLRKPPMRVALPDIPTPTSHMLAKDYYPRAEEVVGAVESLLELEHLTFTRPVSTQLDVPDRSFTGPF